jgi:hypothetical protein
LFNNDKNSWFGCIDALLQYLNVNSNFLLKSKPNVKKYLLSKLRIKYEAIWRQELYRDISGQGYGIKLRTYRLFKNTFNFEHYLSFGNYSQRKLLTKFCISAHDLEMEKERYIGLKAHDRKCKLCKIDIEDECHFLLQCPKLEIEGKEFLELISKEYNNFNSLDINNKFIWLMSSEDDCVIQHLYKLLYNLNIKKQSILANGV